MPIKVTFFATLKDKAGRSNYELETGAPILVKDLKQRLSQVFPGIDAVSDQILVAVNQDFSFDDELVPEGAEVAVFPPVSGGAAGATICRIVTAELDLNSLLDEITTSATGAACIFTGIVRGSTEKGDFRETLSLEYEAYIPMAEAKLRQVAEEIRARWPAIEGISIVQRIGLMEPRTPTVVVACSAAHRDTGVFEAAHYGIDRLKEIVPIWKKEIGPKGETWVEGSYIPGMGD
jgi:molybdopterin synthase catalytic subunit